MSNKYKVVAEHDVGQNNWAVKIVPPHYIQGNKILQDPIWYYLEVRFTTKEDAYKFAKQKLRDADFTEDAIENGIEYE